MFSWGFVEKNSNGGDWDLDILKPPDY